jgi:predicted Ser/Thr protein kinase
MDTVLEVVTIDGGSGGVKRGANNSSWTFRIASVRGDIHKLANVIERKKKAGRTIKWELERLEVLRAQLQGLYRGIVLGDDGNVIDTDSGPIGNRRHSTGKEVGGLDKD